MPISVRVERRIWWLTVSNAEDKSRRMRNDEWDEALAAPSDCEEGLTANIPVTPEKTIQKQMSKDTFNLVATAAVWDALITSLVLIVNTYTCPLHKNSM